MSNDMQVFPIATKQAPYTETDKSHKNNANLHLQINNFLKNNSIFIIGRDDLNAGGLETPKMSVGL